MGISDDLSSAADYLRPWVPDPTPVTGACRTAYDAGRAAAGTVDAKARAGAARVLGVITSAADKGSPHLARISEAMPPRDAWLRAALNLTDHVLAEASKPYTGPLYKIGKETLFKKDNTPPPKEKAAAELQYLRQRVERLEAMVGRSTENYGPPNKAAAGQKPENVIRDFMLKKFSTEDLLDTPWWLPRDGNSRKTDV